jgi:predicted MFS family arabinose efflux permease
LTAITSENEKLLSRGYTTWLLAVLLIVSSFNFLDRAILTSLAQPIKEDLKLTDGQLGLLQGLAFAVIYSVLGVPIGWLAERTRRLGIIAVCVAVWSAMTVLCGFAANFIQLFFCRVGVGVGEAGFLSPTSSLLADHFKANKRASMLAIIMLGTPIGYLIGPTLGGWISQEWTWRYAFMIVGAPGLIVSALVFFTLKEPPRGLAEGQVRPKEPAPSIPSVIKHLWSLPTFRQVLLGGAIAGFSLNAIGQFSNPFFVRVHHLNFRDAGLTFGLISFFANGIGTLLGGFGVDWISKRDQRWAVWGPAVGLVITPAVYLFGFSAPTLAVAIPLIAVGNMMLITFYTPTFATVQNLVGPRMRASAVALFSLVFSMVGAGLGPTVMGMISDAYAQLAFGAADFKAACPGGMGPKGAAHAVDLACRGASSDGLRHALLTVQVFFLWAAVHFVLASRTLKKDLYQAPAA